MGRPPRIQYEGALYHVYPRGNRREPIADTDQDYRVLERYLIEAALKTKVRLRAWYPMPNHLHSMAETPFANISEFMHHWQSRYARYYNTAHGKTGHLFQGRYGCRLVQSDAYQKELIRYIALNPYRSMNPQAAKKFGDRYSSQRFYMGETCPSEVWGWIEPMLMMFGDTLVNARKHFAQYLAEGLKNGNWQDFYKPTHGILGNQAFIKTVEAHQQKQEDARQLHAWQRDALMQNLWKSATSIFGIDSDALASPSQRRDLSRVRQAFAYAGRRLGLPTTALAKELGRDHSAISQMVRVVEEKGSPSADQLLLKNESLTLSHTAPLSRVIINCKNFRNR